MAKKVQHKKVNQQAKKAQPEKKQFDHAAKASQVKAAYKSSVESLVNTGLILADYQAELKDNREFTRFWRDHLHWAKATVYRLADVGKHFAHLPGKTLAYFDLSALYLLATKSMPPALRKKAIKQAESGKFVSHKEVKEWVGKKPTDPAIPSRNGTIRIDLEMLTTEAKKVKLDPEAFLELLERLRVVVDWQGKKPGEAANAINQPKKEVAA
jgi:hypothetical protein